jgi:hypothetical protein
MPEPFADNPDYRAEIRAILQLHRMWQEGKGESPEADALRDATDGHWEHLTDIERKRLQGLSQDLNVSGDAYALEPMTAVGQAKLVQAGEARHGGDWDCALEILRACEKSVAPALLCYLRGAIWAEAGDKEVAAVFFRHAARIEPANRVYSSLSSNPLPVASLSISG